MTIQHCIGFMLDAAIANASKARGLKCSDIASPALSEALEQAEDAFDTAAEALRRARAAADLLPNADESDDARIDRLATMPGALVPTETVNSFRHASDDALRFVADHATSDARRELAEAVLAQRARIRMATPALERSA